jgi:hypothetical protein
MATSCNGSTRLRAVTVISSSSVASLYCPLSSAAFSSCASASVEVNKQKPAVQQVAKIKLQKCLFLSIIQLPGNAQVKQIFRTTAYFEVQLLRAKITQQIART